MGINNFSAILGITFIFVYVYLCWDFGIFINIVIFCALLCDMFNVWIAILKTQEKHIFIMAVYFLHLMMNVHNNVDKYQPLVLETQPGHRWWSHQFPKLQCIKGLVSTYICSQCPESRHRELGSRMKHNQSSVRLLFC